MTTTDAVAQHREESRRSLAQVDADLERGDLESASQALWDAAAHAIKAAAQRRGWPHDSFEALCDVMNRLVSDEGGPVDLHWSFMMANAFDRRSLVWEIPIHEAGIRYCRAPIAEFITTLEGIG